MGAFDDFATRMAIGGALGGEPQAPQPAPAPMSDSDFATRMAIAGGLTPPQAPPGPGPVPLPPSVPLSQRLQNNIGANAPPAGAPIAPMISATRGAGPAPAPQAAPPGAPPPRQPTMADLMPPRARGAGGGGMGGLQARVDADNTRLLRSYNRQAADEERLADAQMAKQSGMAAAQENEALRQQELIEQQQQVDADANRRLSAWNQQSADVAEQIRNQKIDPNRLVGSANAGTKFGMAIAGILGGIAAGRNGENKALGILQDRINKDIQAQQEDYNRQKDYLKQRDTLYGQMRQQHGDEQLAAMQTRQGLLEAAKVQMQAQSDRLGLPEIDARSKAAQTMIGREQGTLQKQIDERKLQVAQAQAAAAAAAQERARKEAIDLAFKVSGERREDRKLDIEEEKAIGAGSKGAEEARKRTVVVPGPDGKPIAKEAIDADSAKSFREYSKISGEAKRLIATMNRTQNTVMGAAEYNAAKSKLIEIMPTMYGYARGPSVAQVEHTFGPEAIPDHQTGLNPANGFGRSGRIKLEDLDKTLNQIDKDTYGATFMPEDNPKGQKAQMPASVKVQE